MNTHVQVIEFLKYLFQLKEKLKFDFGCQKYFLLDAAEFSTILGRPLHLQSANV